MVRGRDRLIVSAFCVSIAGLALVLVSGQHEALAMQGSPEGCVFDQSCDITPGVVAARRLVRGGWFVVVGAGAVLTVLATLAAAARWRRQIGAALAGLALLILGVLARALLLGGYVPPPTFGCQVTGSCAMDPWWINKTPFYDAALLLPVVGSGLIAIALITLLWRTRLPDDTTGRPSS